MESANLNSKVAKATRWSLLTVVCSKMITPLTTIILARILTPEVFGIVAITAIIISFAEMFSEAGIGKYIIQKEFPDQVTENKYRTVGFWVNVMLGLGVWLIISGFARQLAVLFKEPQATLLIIIASFQMVLRALVAVQISIMQRSFQFEKLFVITMITVAFPMLFSIPLAFKGFGAWAIVIGNLAGAFANAVVVWLVSIWRPSLYFDYKILKDMFSFTIWSIAESFTIWLTAWFDALVIGIFVDTYTLGLYRNSITLVSAVIGIITAAVSPVLFTALSRLQDDKQAFSDMFLSFQRKLALFLLPLSVGFFLFGDTASLLVFGDKWIGAGEIIALWGSVSCFMCLFTISGEAFRAQGQPKLSARSQIIHLCFLIPVCIVGGVLGFKVLLYGRTLIRFQLVVVMIMYLKTLIPITYSQMFRNLRLCGVFSLVMGIVALLVRKLLPVGLMADLINITICVLVYFALIFTNKITAKDIRELIIKGKT